jgi:hypothetical protein
MFKAEIMKATIVHDGKGQILGVIKPVDLKEAGSKFTQAGINPGANQHVIDVELDKELEQIPALELHERYEVDVAASKLAKKHHS